MGAALHEPAVSHDEDLVGVPDVGPPGWVMSPLRQIAEDYAPTTAIVLDHWKISTKSFREQGVHPTLSLSVMSSRWRHPS
ncbi:hypothetical protein [Micromonospora sp. KC606]|uniref:hypothetical protein n=1 Tax=Micromonospora sp. KC606 TaxID=2530379 RepID=UPI0014051C82|nr:hypothetical protein [Micromonospora sp. KC606]